MNRFHGKSKTHVFMLSILFLFVVFLLVNTIQVPLLAGTVTCGEGRCTCSCTGGYCDCVAGPGEECMCYCSFPVDFDHCGKFGGPEPPA